MARRWWWVALAAVLLLLLAAALRQPRRPGPAPEQARAVDRPDAAAAPRRATAAAAAKEVARARKARPGRLDVRPAGLAGPVLRHRRSAEQERGQRRRVPRPPLRQRAPPARAPAASRAERAGQRRRGLHGAADGLRVAAGP